MKGPGHVAGCDVIHFGGEGHQSGLALHYADAAPPRNSKYDPHGGVLHHLRAHPLSRGERGEDGYAVVHQRVHRLHEVQSQHVISSPFARQRHRPRDIQPGLRLLPQVLELCLTGQPGVQSHPEVLVGASPGQPNALHAQLAGRSSLPEGHIARDFSAETEAQLLTLGRDDVQRPLR